MNKHTNYFKFEPIKLTKDHLDSMINQTIIMKNYYAMTETYLKLVRSNLDFWHSFYIEK